METDWFQFDYKKSDHNVDMKYHSHRWFEIFYFHQGKTRMLIQQRIYDLQPGDIVLLNGLTMHRVKPHPSYPNVRTTVEFLPEFIDPVLSALQKPELLKLFETLNNSVIRVGDLELLGPFRSCLSRLHQLGMNRARRSKHKDSLLDSHFKTIIIELLFETYYLSKLSRSDIAAQKSAKDLLMEQMLSWIMEHHMQKLTMDQLSRQFNVNKHYISHLFKEITGMTAMEYVMSCRIDSAKYMLEMMPEKRISDIALDVGFESNAHFSRYFRKKVGLSPSSFRKQKRVDDFS